MNSLEILPLHNNKKSLGLGVNPNRNKKYQILRPIPFSEVASDG